MAAAAAAVLGVACADGFDLAGPGSCARSRDLLVVPGDPRILRASGDTVRLEAVLRDACGRKERNVEAAWSSSDPGVARVDGSGLVTAVADGAARVAAEVDTLRTAVDVEVEVVPPASLLTRLGLAVVDDALETTGLAIHGDIALAGTAGGGESSPIIVWSIANPASPERLAAVPSGAAAVEDVAVGPDGRYAAAATGDGILVLDVGEPAEPRVLSRHADGLEGGVLAARIVEIDGRRWIFAAEGGSSGGGGLHILDASSPSSPVAVARYHAGSSFVRDVDVRDGLAFVGHWDAGLVVLDVGNGIAGGAPDAPAVASRIRTVGGQARSVRYWPAGGVVFVTEEDRLQAGEPPDSVGRVHVVDVHDPFSPREVASFRKPGETPLGLSLDEESGILLVAWAALGVRALDVTGTLEGRLEEEGREVGAILPPGPRGRIGIRDVRLHRGVVYATDAFHGLWSFAYDPEAVRE